jgi:hypothetical protein
MPSTEDFVATPIASIPTPTIPAPAPLPEFGEGGEKALKSERAARKSLEDTNALLKQQIAANESALAASQMTLKEQYEQQIAERSQAIIDQANAALAERDAALAERDQRLQTAAQYQQAQENARAIQLIDSTFTQLFSPLLANSSEDLELLHSMAANHLTLTESGEVAALTESGEVTSLNDLVAYFKSRYPSKFKPPATQKTGGGSRNLASGNNFVQQQQGASLELPVANQITPEQFFANRDRIEKGEFVIKDGK